jgi:cell division initiation protein
MKVTPLEIRQKTFERTLRGYDKDEVNAFLLSLSQEWERLQDEMKELRMKQESADKEVAKLREVESSLYKTLKTAEDTGANVIGQANKSAELMLKEAQLKSEALLNESKIKAKNTIEEADAASREMLGEMEDRIKALTEQYKTFELHRDNLLSDLKRLAAETIDRVERAARVNKSFDIEQHIAQAKKEAKRAVFPNSDYESTTVRKITIEETVEKVLVEAQIPVAEEKIPAPTPVPVPMIVEEKFQRSFFDDFQ